MLEIIKEVLISNKKKELKQKEEITVRIEKLKKKEREENFDLVDQKLTELEQKLELLTTNTFKRIIHGQDIKGIYQEYINLSHDKTNKLNEFNKERDLLLKKLQDLSEDKDKIEAKIELIRKAQSLKELGITEKQAKDMIKDFSEQSEENIIKTVFLNIKNNENLETREDIYRNLQTLYQTNISPFVLAMKKIKPIDLIEELIDVNIVIDEDKMEFIKELSAYIKSPSHNLLPIIQKLERTDRLDAYYYNEVQKALANMERYSNYPSTAVSHIITLSVLVSIAKSNKKERQLQK